MDKLSFEFRQDKERAKKPRQLGYAALAGALALTVGCEVNSSVPILSRSVVSTDRLWHMTHSLPDAVARDETATLYLVIYSKNSKSYATATAEEVRTLNSPSAVDILTAGHAVSDLPDCSDKKVYVKSTDHTIIDNRSNVVPVAGVRTVHGNYDTTQTFEGNTLRDVALLDVDSRFSRETPSLILSEVPPQSGDIVFGLGHALGTARLGSEVAVWGAEVIGVTHDQIYYISGDYAFGTDHAARSPEHGDSGGPLVDVSGRQLGITVDTYHDLTAEQIKDRFGFLVGMAKRTATLGIAQITNAHTISTLKQSAECHPAQVAAYSVEPGILGG